SESGAGVAFPGGGPGGGDADASRRSNSRPVAVSWIRTVIPTFSSLLLLLIEVSVRPCGERARVRGMFAYFVGGFFSTRSSWSRWPVVMSHRLMRLKPPLDNRVRPSAAGI